jgi:hypothetical protein
MVVAGNENMAAKAKHNDLSFMSSPVPSRMRQRWQETCDKLVLIGFDLFDKVDSAAFFIVT